jgi:hypothetical protein
VLMWAPRAACRTARRILFIDHLQVNQDNEMGVLFLCGRAQSDS